MKIQVNEKIVNVPDEVIQQYQSKLELTEDEAIALYLEEESYIENKELLQLEEKAKKNKISHGIEQKERKKRENTVKPNENKQFLIKIIADLFKNTENIANISITNTQKYIEFEYNSKKYKIDLIEHREPKNK